MSGPDPLEVLIVNSNTSAQVTETVRAGAQRVARANTRITALTAPFGVAAIETPQDATIAARATLAALRGYDGQVDAAIIACFSDPGLAEARRTLPYPVIGIAEAAMQAAGRLGRRFSIVTVAPSSVAQIRDLAGQYGFAAQLCGVHALETGVLASHANPAQTARGLNALAAQAVSEEGAQAIILGGAVTAGMAAILSVALTVPVYEGVRCAMAEAERLVTPT